MKVQDIAFFITFILFLLKRDAKWIIITGIVSLFLSILLFINVKLFTAERLTWYAAAFFSIAIVKSLANRK